MSDPISWQSILRTNITSLPQLLRALEIDSNTAATALLSNPRFRINIPQRIVSKMGKNDLSDPLFRQFVPLIDEAQQAPGFTKEPVCDQQFKAGSKILQKYTSRALFVTTGACAMNCRFCFRQNYPYNDHEEATESLYPFEREIDFLKNSLSISEAILSGGDPLSLSNRQLKHLIDRLNSIEHLERIRFHTRFPIGIPERIDDDFLSILNNSSKQIIFILHTNHIREFDQEILLRLNLIKKLGIPILSQSVLLKGVNDSVQALEDLFRFLGKNGIIPYYLHQLDRVEGAHHFEVPVSTGLSIMQELHRKLSGYLVPKYVKEIPGEPGKTALI